MGDKSKLEKAQIIFDILGKILIPVVVVLVSILWGRYQNEVLQKEKEYELEQKYLEIFYKDITSETSDRRKLAEAMLKEIHPDLQIKLTRVFASLYPDRALAFSNNIANDTTQTSIIRTEAQKIAFHVGKQFIIVAPSEDESVTRTVSVKGKTPYYNKTHYSVANLDQNIILILSY